MDDINEADKFGMLSNSHSEACFGKAMEDDNNADKSGIC